MLNEYSVVGIGLVDYGMEKRDRRQV